MIYSNISIPQADLEAFCRRHPIHKLSLFGSVLRDDFTQQSDIDILVEFVPGAKITYFSMVDMQDELEKILEHKVDLRTPQELSPYFRQEVIDTAELLYEST